MCDLNVDDIYLKVGILIIITIWSGLYNIIISYIIMSLYQNIIVYKNIILLKLKN